MRVKLLLTVISLVCSLPSFAWYFNINNTTNTALLFAKHDNSCFGNVDAHIVVPAHQASKTYYVELKHCSAAKLRYSVYAQAQPTMVKGDLVYTESRSWLAMLGLGHSKPDGYIEGNNLPGTAKVADNLVTFTLNNF